jgi:predicted RNase H-like nuclease (RuvC/YqgF family)
LGDLLNKPKYLVALYRRELQATIQISLKTTQELVDEGIQGEVLASMVRHLEELESRLNQEDFPSSSWSISKEVSWASTKHAWQTLEAIDISVHELSEEVRHWKDKDQEIKSKLEEMDRKLNVLRTCLDQAPASISGLPSDTQLCYKAQQLRAECTSLRVEELDQITVEIQQVIGRIDNQIRQIEEVKANYYHLEANIKAINDLLSQINRKLEQVQKKVGNIRLCSQGRTEYTHLQNELERGIGPITAKRMMADLDVHLAVSERLKEQAEKLVERCEECLEG